MSDAMNNGASNHDDMPALREVQAPRSERIPRHADRQQIDIGTYTVYQGTVQVGELFVVPIDGGKIEYWAFNSSYRAPSSMNPNARLDFVYSSSSYGSSTDFLAHLKRAGYTSYIEATCVDKALT